ncbi:MAG: nicotinate-nucleotide--dimethylbenzimidazole phosphoribosyltransferase [Actinomycetia bacterium]|nr:nicotinate-nucleotide--dimethylbenzimidazole phosphoribosyltransferase [Actinomycetes bacterium]
MTAETQLQELIAGIVPVDAAFEAAARARLDALSKPPGSLGKLEDLAARVAVVQHDVRPAASPSAIVLMAGDHGVVAEGVSAYPQNVTWQMLANFSAGGAAINQLAKHAGARLVLVDVGVATDTSALAGVVQAKVRPGTANMAEGPAMTREEAAAAILTGARITSELVADGVRIIGTGEMGIGNSTAAAALTAAFTGSEPARVVGRGTGLDRAGVAHKATVIERALERNGVAGLDPLGVLAAAGGLEIAGMAGVVLGAAAGGVCAVFDGFISGAAALVALRLCPEAAGYVFPSHLSSEPGHAVVLDALGLAPVLELDMRLGEGTGAALAIEIIGAACAVMSGMATFAEAGVSEADDA